MVKKRLPIRKNIITSFGYIMDNFCPCYWYTSKDFRMYNHVLLQMYFDQIKKQIFLIVFNYQKKNIIFVVFLLIRIYIYVVYNLLSWIKMYFDISYTFT